MSAANARNLIILASSLFLGGCSNFCFLVSFPTPMTSPWTLSQFEKIFSPIQASTGPTTGNSASRCRAPSKDRISMRTE